MTYESNLRTPGRGFVVSRPHVAVPSENYVPSRDNPPLPLRPGADDHKKHLSLPMQATYHRGHV